MQPYRSVHPPRFFFVQPPDYLAGYTFLGNGADLLRLYLGILGQAAFDGSKQDLERVHPRDIRSDGQYRDCAGCAVIGIVAYDQHGTLLGNF